MTGMYRLSLSCILLMLPFLVSCGPGDVFVRVDGFVVDGTTLAPLDSVVVSEVSGWCTGGCRTVIDTTTSDGYFSDSFLNALPGDSLEFSRRAYETKFVPFDSLDQVGERRYRAIVTLDRPTQ